MGIRTLSASSQVGVDILGYQIWSVKPPPGSALYYGLQEGRVLYVVES